jgi:tetratricopeptide (TPR) repeat protein
LKKKTSVRSLHHKWFFAFFITSVCTLSAQTISDYFTPDNILKFAQHLYDEEYFERAAIEYERYLYADPLASKSPLLYTIGRCYLHARNPETAIKYFSQASHYTSHPCLNDSIHIALCASYLLGRDYRNFQNSTCMLSEKAHLSADLESKLLELRGLYHLERGNWQAASQELTCTSPTQRIKTLQNLAIEGQNLPRKSPMIAGLMSGILPGSGKIYSERPLDGLYSFLLTTGTAWLAFEGYRDQGMSSTKGWLFGSASLFFYVGNIYGSVISVKLYNKSHQDRIDDQIQAHLDIWFRL